MFFEYHQTPINGEYVSDSRLCAHVLIEAQSCEEANRIAESLGMCFSNNDDDYTEPCRWERCYYEIVFPSKWDNLTFYNPEDYSNFIFERRRRVGIKLSGPHSRIHYKGGRIREIG